MIDMKRSPLNKVSKKRSSQMSRYSKLKKDYIENFPVCEICKISPSHDIHHRMGRMGEKLNQTAWWMALCRDCHMFCHSNPKEAMERGYILSRL